MFEGSDIVKFVAKIQELTPTQTIDIDGRKYTNHEIHMQATPHASALALGTLAGLTDLAKLGVDALKTEDGIVQVVGYSRVDLLALREDAYGNRRIFAKAELPQACCFQFASFLAPDQFNIQLLSNFILTPDLKSLITLASNLQAETVVTAQDDGTSQQATLKTGAVSKSVVEMKPRWLLQPYRTFREVEQPASEFIFRLQNGQPGTMPKVALFEADGGAWKIDAAKNIADWLTKQLGDGWKNRVIR